MYSGNYLLHLYHHDHVHVHVVLRSWWLITSSQQTVVCGMHMTLYMAHVCTLCVRVAMLQCTCTCCACCTVSQSILTSRWFTCWGVVTKLHSFSHILREVIILHCPTGVQYCNLWCVVWVCHWNGKYDACHTSNITLFRYHFIIQCIPKQRTI